MAKNDNEHMMSMNQATMASLGDGSHSTNQCYGNALVTNCALTWWQSSNVTKAVTIMNRMASQPWHDGYDYYAYNDDNN
jgi:hypothetical protein